MYYTNSLLNRVTLYTDCRLIVIDSPLLWALRPLLPTHTHAPSPPPTHTHTRPLPTHTHTHTLPTHTQLAIQLLDLTILSLHNDVTTPFQLCGIVAPKLVSEYIGIISDMSAVLHKIIIILRSIYMKYIIMSRSVSMCILCKLIAD